MVVRIYLRNADAPLKEYPVSNIKEAEGLILAISKDIDYSKYMAKIVADIMPKEVINSE